MCSKSCVLVASHPAHTLAAIAGGTIGRCFETLLAAATA